MRKAAEKKKRYLLRRGMRMLSVLLLPGIFSACSGLQDTATEIGFQRYYVNAEANQLETVSYLPTATETSALVEELIAQQQKETPPASMQELLPTDMTIRQFTLDGGMLTLDFDASYTQMTPSRELLCRAGLVREFLQIAGVERVLFTVNGESLKDSYGNEIGAMSNDSFVENSASTINAYQSVTMTLYFTDETGTKLIPESRKVYYISSEPLEWAVVEEIEKGPRLSGHYPTYTSDTTILSVITQDEVCYVNLESGGAASSVTVEEEVQIYSIVNSLVDTCGVSKVQFSIDGNSNIVFRDNLSLTEQFTKNDTLIERE